MGTKTPFFDINRPIKVGHYFGERLFRTVACGASVGLAGAIFFVVTKDSMHVRVGLV
jgi:hypothetical protein